MRLRPGRAPGASALALTFTLLAGAAAAGDPAEPPFHRHLRSPARLGIEVQDMSAELRAFFRAPPDAGLLVSRVEAGSPAAEAGLAVGDVLVELDGEKLESPHDLVWKVMRAPAGEKRTLVVVHDGESRSVEIVPRGEPQPPFLDPDEWRRPGGEALRELREGLRSLEKRLEELEKKVDREIGQRT